MTHQHTNATRARREAEGLCVECGLVACEPGRICDECRAVMRAKWATRFAGVLQAMVPRAQACSRCGRSGHNARSCATARAA